MRAAHPAATIPRVTVRELVPILQMAIGPAILVSGVGLLLLSMTNRLGRIVDRSRETTAEMRAATPREREHLAAELRILLRRARVARAA